MTWLKYATPKNIAILCGVLFYFFSVWQGFNYGYSKRDSEAQKAEIERQEAVITATEAAIDEHEEDVRAIVDHNRGVERLVTESANVIDRIEVQGEVSDNTAIPDSTDGGCPADPVRVLQNGVYRSFPTELFFYESGEMPGTP